MKSFLGASMDSKLMLFSLPQEKGKMFRARIVAMIKRGRKDQVAPLKQWQSVVGTIAATGDCVPAVRLNSLLEVQAQAISSGTRRAHISPEALKDLWKICLCGTGRALFPGKSM